MRLDLPVTKAYRLINHGPCCLIATGDGERRNLAPINWTMPIQDEPPLVLMAVEKGVYTDDLLQANGEFVVNVVGGEWVRQILFCGQNSGRKMDKLTAAGFTPLPSKTVKPPHLMETIGHMECRVVNIHAYEGIHLYVGQVLYAEVESEFFDGEYLRVEAARTPHHIGGGRFAVTEKLA
ncbi:MAG: flavin reductase family protein [Elusimicrobia bacterium]|nr:flavin reductase family protein [Elusimicrobiota bacterium]